MSRRNARYLVHARALGHSFSFCGRDARHNAEPVITTSLRMGDVDCKHCLKVERAASLVTKPLPRLGEPRVRRAPDRGAA